MTLRPRLPARRGDDGSATVEAVILAAVLMFGTPDITIRCEAQRYRVNHVVLDHYLADVKNLAHAVRIVPSIRDGAPDGFKLYAIRPDSHIARLGFLNGDTVRRVNGRELSTPDKALETYSALRNAKRFEVEITRRGQPMTLEYILD